MNDILGGFSVFAIVLIVLFVIIFIVKQYKRCPSNRILVVFGKVGANQASRCYHGGGKFIIPLIQDYAYLNLEPLVIDIPLEGALSLNNIRVNVPATFTVGISTDAVLMNNAAERLLPLNAAQIRELAQDIILGQLSLATFVNPAGLESVGNNIYVSTVNSGPATVVDPGDGAAGVIRQGSVEGSNVSVMTEMIDMITAQRAFESVSKAISTSDEMLGMANSMRR